MVVLFLVVFVAMTGFGIILPIFPFYAERVGASPTAITWTMAAFTLGQAVAAPLWGRLSDAYGRRLVLTLTMFGQAVAYVMLAYADSLWLVVLSRVLGGMMAGNVATAFAYVADVTDEEQRPAALGKIGAAMGVGFICGPALGGLLAGADRVLVSEVPFDPGKLADFLAADQDLNPPHYAICVVSEGAFPSGGQIIEGGEEDAYGHKKLGGIGAWIAAEVRRRTGRDTLEQKLAYLMRSGAPDSIDRLVGMVFGTMAFESLQAGKSGLMTAVVDGSYRVVSLADVRAGARPANVETYYDAEAYRPRLGALEGRSLMLG